MYCGPLKSSPDKVRCNEWCYNLPSLIRTTVEPGLNYFMASCLSLFLLLNSLKSGIYVGGRSYRRRFGTSIPRYYHETQSQSFVSFLITEEYLQFTGITALFQDLLIQTLFPLSCTIEKTAVYSLPPYSLAFNNCWCSASL